MFLICPPSSFQWECNFDKILNMLRYVFGSGRPVLGITWICFNDVYTWPKKPRRNCLRQMYHLGGGFKYVSFSAKFDID